MGKVSDRLWDKAGAMRIPLTGAFELLPLCNLHCKMCYVRKSAEEVRDAGGLLPAEFWLDAARQARDEGMLYPLLTGGEPFLRRDFQEIMGGMLEMGLQVSINSNGTMIDEAMARWLGLHMPVKINITLYGASEDGYERVCGDGDAFNRMNQGVMLLKKYGVPVKFNTSIAPGNADELEAIMGLAKLHDIPIQVATYMFPPIRRNGTMIGQNYRLSPEKAAMARVKADWLQSDPQWFLGQAERYRHFVALSDEMLQKLAAGEPRRMTCRAGRCSFWLDWEGNISNCGMYPSAAYPLKGKRLSEVWKQVVHETEKIRFSPVCTNCPNARLCHACIAMVYNECGDVNGRPDYLCRMHAASAKYYQEYAEKIRGECQAVKPFAASKERDCDIEDF